MGAKESVFLQPCLTLAILHVNYSHSLFKKILFFNLSLAKN